MRKLFWAVPAILLGLCAAEAKTVDRILAQVNDDIITLSDLRRNMAEVRKELESKYSGEQLDQMIQKAEKEVLDNLIQEKLLYQKAMELGYNSNVDARVSAYIQNLMKQNNIKDSDELENALSQQGQTLNDFRDDIRKSMIGRDLVQDFVGSRITLLAAEIENRQAWHLAQGLQTDVGELVAADGQFLEVGQRGQRVKTDVGHLHETDIERFERSDAGQMLQGGIGDLGSAQVETLQMLPAFHGG